LTSEIRRAAEIIRGGGLVAFPTETVYGLGANALDERAVERIYRAKGRPADSPLIVHAADVEMARSLVIDWPEAAAELARKHWPGPLTLVLRKAGHVPDRVTAGLPTVGVRVPAHPVALALIREAGVPLAAPSANRFTQLSPTDSRHVEKSLADYVLEGGPSRVGIESTVISLAGDRPVLLRPGAIAIAGAAPAEPAAGAHPSPGMHARHYAPRTRLILGAPPATGRGFTWRLPDDPAAAARLLYATLHELDAMNLDWIAVSLPPDTAEWAAVRDRLKRAAS
jgi:L-threonylcarbamoyladenylate synthase